MRSFHGVRAPALMALAIFSLAIVFGRSLPVALPLPLAEAQSRERATIGGKIVCVGCYLATYGAQAQCTLYAKHAQGLLAEDGALYTFLDNARGHALIAEKKLRDRTAKIEAFRFPKAQVLEVVRYQLEEGGAFVQYDYCKLCGFEKGDHGGKDLCDDCAK